MAETSSSSSTTTSRQNAAAKPPRPRNPVFKMMGLPNFTFKLPSRNWMIFLTITGSFTAAVMYDRRQKKRVQQKWSDMVAHISKETLPLEQTRRRLTVFLSAPPGDGLRSAREYFIEYVKPVLVSAALDYEVIEGRKEGEVRAALAEKIRRNRRQAGERSSVVEEQSKESVIAEVRQRMGITEEPGPRGDIVIGRHTWKEYIRGLHEGWLGPIDPPPPPPSQPAVAETVADTTDQLSSDSPAVQSPDESPSPAPEEKSSSETKEDKKETEEEKKPKRPTPAYISPTQYSTQSLPVSIPATFEASSPIQFPHLLGFLNAPIRIYRFLTRRYLADAVGQEVAAIVLASASRPYFEEDHGADLESGSSNGFPAEPTRRKTYEQQTVLEHEEQEWHKSVRKAAEARKLQADNDNVASVDDVEKIKLLEKEEREWIDDVVIDPRIAARMHRSILSPEEEARANRIAEGQEWILGQGEKPKELSFWQRVWIEYGYGEDPELAKKKPIIGNLDSEE